MAEKFISVRDAALILGVSEKKIIDLVDEGKLSAYKIGGEYLRLSKEQIESLKNSKVIDSDTTQHEYTFIERVNDFFYYNDFYIFSLVIIAMLMFFIFTA